MSCFPWRHLHRCRQWLGFSFCSDTGDEEYIFIEAEGAANLDANIVIEIDAVGDKNNNFEAAIDVDLIVTLKTKLLMTLVLLMILTESLLM